MKTSHFLAVLLSLSASAYSVAQAPDKRFEAQASLGILNNSTLVVAELDQVSNEQDMAFTFHAKLAGQWQARPALKLQGAYLFARKDYQQFDGYDLDLHQVYVDGQYDFAALSVGIRHDFAYAILQDQAFLRLNQSSLYAAKYITPTTYLRSAFNYKTKHFDSMNARDATNQGVGLNLFQFFNQGSTMLSLGLNVEKEQAVDTQFDFNANSLSAGMSQTFDLLGKTSKLQLAWRYQNNDYAQRLRADDSAREDTQQRYELQWQLALWPQFSVVSKVEYSDYNSTLAALNYTQTVSSISLEANF